MGFVEAGGVIDKWMLRFSEHAGVGGSKDERKEGRG